MGQSLQDVEDLGYFKYLKELVLSNKIEKLSLNGLSHLTTLYIAKNKLSNLDIINMPLAVGLNNLTNVSIKGCPNLESLNMMNNKITQFNFSAFPNLKYLLIDDNEFVKLDISKNLDLLQIIIDNNTSERLI